MRKKIILRKIFGFRIKRRVFSNIFFSLKKSLRRSSRFSCKIFRTAKKIYKSFKLSPRALRKTGATILAVAIIATTVFYTFKPNSVLGQTYTLTQNDWSGGTSGSTVAAPDNLTGYNHYASASGVTAGAGSVSLTPSSGSVSESFATTTNRDAGNTTAVWSGDGQVSSLADFVPTGLTSVLTNAGFGGYWSCSYMDQTNRKLYMMNATGHLAEYNVVAGTVEDLTTSSGISAFWGENACDSMTMLNGDLYVVNGYPSRIARLDPDTADSAVSLAPYIGGFGGFINIVADTTRNMIYVSGYNFGSYNPANNEGTYLRETLGLPHDLGYLVFDTNDSKIYLIGATQLYVYNPGSGQATDLTTTSGFGDIFNTYGLARFAFSEGDDKIYLASINEGHAILAVYDPASNEATDIGSALGWSASFVYGTGTIAPNADGSTAFLPIRYVDHWQAYHPGSPGSLEDVDLSAYLNGMNTTGMSTISYDNTGHAWYALTDGNDTQFRFVRIIGNTPPHRATSTTLDSTARNIASATLTKNDTPGTGTVSYQLSNDGGAHWEDVAAGNSHTFTTTGSDMRFRISLTGNATVQDVSITYYYYSASGELVSSKLDGVDPTTVVNQLAWNENASLPAGTSVVASMRTAATANGLDSASWINLQNGKPASEPTTVAESFDTTTNRDATNTTAAWTGSGEASRGDYSIDDLTSALTAAGAPSSKMITAMAADDASGVIYIGFEGGDPGKQFFKYDIVLGEATDLTTLSDFDDFYSYYYGITGIRVVNGKAYLTFGMGSGFAVYDPGTGKANDLRSSFPGSTYIQAMSVDSAHHLIYLIGNVDGDIVFWSYDTVSGDFTVLTTAFGINSLSSPWNDSYCYMSKYDPSHGILYIAICGYHSGAHLLSVNIGSVTATDISDSSGLSVFWGSGEMANSLGLTADGTLYIGGGLFASLDPDTGNATDLTASSGFALHGIGWNYGEIGPSGNTLYLPTDMPGLVTGYDTTNSGAVFEMLPAFSANGICVVAASETDGKVYIGTCGGSLGSFVDINPAQASSLTLDATSQNILSATLVKNDTPGTGTVAYQLSNDGGAHWETVTPGSLHVFSSTGSDLRFKILVTGNATVQDVSITYYSAIAGSASCSKASGTVTCGDTTVPASFQDGSGDRFFQYKLTLVSDGSATPIISSVGLQFVVNAPPEVQNVTAVQNANGTVSVSYEVRDPDTDSGSPANQGYITPSFEYWDGSAYETMSALSSGDTDRKEVDDTNWKEYSATWHPATDYGGHYLPNTIKIKVTANDGEGANPTGSGESAVFLLDTKNPTGNAVTVDAAASPQALNLSSSDDSALTMKIGVNDPTLASPVYNGAYSASYNPSSPLVGGDTIYVRFIDAYNNTSSILSATVPATPGSAIIQDASNVKEGESTHQLFLAWRVNGGGSFGSYKVYRSASSSNPVPWTLLGDPITSVATNYYLDQNLIADATWSYYVVTTDSNGNRSNRSAVVTGTANGTQDGSEGGGGIATPPVITSVASSPSSTSAVITWNTDTLSNSLVEYGPVAGGYGSSVSVGAFVNNAAGVGAHTVILSGLTPAAAYHFRVTSTDTAGQSTLATNGGSGYEFSTVSGPIISGVTTENVTNYTARVSWTTNILASTQIIYSIHADLSEPTVTSGTSDPTTTHTVTIGNLIPNTDYYFYVKSADTTPSHNESEDKNVVDGRILYYNFQTTNDSTAPIVSGVSVSTQTTAADIIWTTNELADSQVEYGLTTAYGSASLLDATVTARHVTTLTGLTPNTTYNYRIKSRDVNLVLTTDVNRTFTTAISDDVTPPVITATTAVDLALNSAGITWTTNEAATSFVEYGLTTALGSSTGDVTDRVTDHRVDLTGLNANQKYYYKVHSEDAAGNAATDNNDGDLYFFTTVADTTPPVISNVGATVVNDTSASIVWTTDSPATSRVVYGTSHTYGSQTSVDSTLTMAHAVTLTGLTKQTTYYYKVVSADASGNAAENDNSGNGYSFSTTDQPGVVARARAPETDTTPPLIFNLTVSSIGKNTAEVNWNTSEAANTIVRYGADTAYGKLAGTIEERLSAHRVSLSELSPGTVYHLIAMSQDAAGNIAVSPDKIFATLRDDGTIIPIPEQTPNENSNVNAPSSESQPVPAEEPVNPLMAAVSALQDIVKNFISGQAQPTDPDAFSKTVDELAGKIISPPTIVGLTPKVEVNGKDALVSWSTDKKANGTVAYAAAEAYLPGTDQPYIHFVSSTPGDFTTVHEINLANLEPATSYHFQVRSKGLIGGEAQSSDMTFRTGSDLPVVSNLKVIEVKESEATISWTTNVPTSTEVRYKNVASGDELTQGDTALLRDHLFKLGNLKSGIAYSFSVSATDEFGNKITNGPYALATSKDNAPPVISKVSSNSTLYPGKQTSVQTIITWTTDEPATSNVFYQEGLAKDAPQVEIPPDQALVKNHTVVVTKFRPMTVYKFRVESTDAAGNLAKSSDFLVLTPQQKASVLDIIIGNFEQVFGWTKKL